MIINEIELVRTKDDGKVQDAVQDIPIHIEHDIDMVTQLESMVTTHPSSRRRRGPTISSRPGYKSTATRLVKQDTIDRKTAKAIRRAEEASKRPRRPHRTRAENEARMSLITGGKGVTSSISPVFRLVSDEIFRTKMKDDEYSQESEEEPDEKVSYIDLTVPEILNKINLKDDRVRIIAIDLVDSVSGRLMKHLSNVEFAIKCIQHASYLIGRPYDPEMIKNLFVIIEYDEVVRIMNIVVNGFVNIETIPFEGYITTYLWILGLVSENLTVVFKKQRIPLIVTATKRIMNAIERTVIDYSTQTKWLIARNYTLLFACSILYHPLLVNRKILEKYGQKCGACEIPPNIPRKYIDMLRNHLKTAKEIGREIITRDDSPYNDDITSIFN